MKRPPLLLLYGVDERTLPIDAAETLEMTRRAAEALEARGWEVAASQVQSDFGAALAPFEPDQWLVFNLCEGSPDQGFYYARAAQELEQRGYAFTGSTASVLHQTQSKVSMKRLLEAGGLPTPRWQEASEAQALQFEAFPAILKPADEHCSLGITRDSVVRTLAEARAQAQAVLERFPGGAIIEEFLDSPEYAIALWGPSGRLEVLGVSVIRYDAFPELQDRLCTFDAKWLANSEAYLKTMPACPAPLEPEMAAELARLARRVHRVCGLRDYSRIDVRLRNGRPMVLDVNSNCDLSETGGFANTARAAGWEYGAMLERLALMAASRAKGARSPRIAGAAL
jgi:D-alanine-D-alanine ligase